MPITACLVAWYAPSPVLPRNPPMLEVLTIDPYPWARITRSSSRRHNQTS